jgi:hypothetical protein
MALFVAIKALVRATGAAIAITAPTSTSRLVGSRWLNDQPLALMGQRTSVHTLNSICRVSGVLVNLINVSQLKHLQ